MQIINKINYFNQGNKILKILKEKGYLSIILWSIYIFQIQSQYYLIIR